MLIVATGAKGPVTGAGQDDGTDFFVVAGLVQRLDDLVAGLAAKRVHLLRAVDRDPGNGVAHFVQDVFEFLRVSPIELVVGRCAACQPAIVRPPER
jgi:hypothetical protein